MIAEPAIATATRNGDRVTILGDGEPVLTLPLEKARWLLVRLAEALARRT